MKQMLRLIPFWFLLASFSTQTVFAEEPPPDEMPPAEETATSPEPVPEEPAE